MSHDATTPRNHGFWGYLTQRFGHPAAKKIAGIIFTSPRIIAMVHTHREIAEFTGEGLDFVAGMFEIPGAGPPVIFLNHVLDAFSSEARELLEKLAADPENPELLSKAKIEVAKEANKLADSDAFLVLGTLHKTRDCETVATYVAKMKQSSSPVKDGKPRPSMPSRAESDIIPMKFGTAFSLSKPLCSHPTCYPPKGDKIEASAPKAEAAKPGATPGVTLGRLVLEWRKEDKASADAFRLRFNAANAETHAKVLAFFSRGGTLDDLKQLADMPEAEWSHLLDAMMTTEHHSVVQTLLANGGKRMQEEKEELVRVFEKIGDGARAVQMWADNQLPLAQAHNERIDRSSARWWLLGAALLFVAVVGSMAIHLANHAH